MPKWKVIFEDSVDTEGEKTEWWIVISKDMYFEAGTKESAEWLCGQLNKLEEKE
jgi:hypothetical protein